MDNRTTSKDQVLLTFESEFAADLFMQTMSRRSEVRTESIYGVETFHVVAAEKGKQE